MEYKTNNPQAKSAYEPTVIELRKALQALYEAHTCSGICRTCDYAYNLLAGDPDNGAGVGEPASPAGAVVFATPEHTFAITEDGANPGQRLYESRATDGQRHGWTGEELANLADWVQVERARAAMPAPRFGAARPYEVVEGVLDSRRPAAWFLTCRVDGKPIPDGADKAPCCGWPTGTLVMTGGATRELWYTRR